MNIILNNRALTIALAIITATLQATQAMTEVESRRLELHTASTQAYLVNNRYLCATGSSMALIVDPQNCCGFARFFSSTEHVVAEHLTARRFNDYRGDDTHIRFSYKELSPSATSLSFEFTDVLARPLGSHIVQTLQALILALLDASRTELVAQKKGNARARIFIPQEAGTQLPHRAFIIGQSTQGIVQEGDQSCVVSRHSALSSSWMPEHLLPRGNGFALEMSASLTVPSAEVGVDCTLEHPCIIFTKDLGWSVQQRDNEQTNLLERPSSDLLALVDITEALQAHGFLQP